MRTHLDDMELAAAIAGLDLDGKALDHLSSCLACRREVESSRALIAERGREMARSEPDWEAQRERIMAALPVAPVVVPLARHWAQPLLAAAAALAVTVGVVLLRRTTEVQRPQMAPEEIIAEVQTALDREEVPGFAALESLLVADLSDAVEASEPAGFEALSQLVPGLDELETLLTTKVS